MRTHTLPRWLTYCRLCNQRAVWIGEKAPTEHPCPARGPEGISGFESVQRIEWRGYRPSRGSCRQNEGRTTVVEPPPRPGRCTLMCRGSLSPSCYCPTCYGEQHGAENLANPEHVIVELPDHDAVLSSEPDIMDQLIARTPDYDVPRKARKST